MSLVVPGTMLFAVFGAGAAGLSWVLFTPQAKRNDRTCVLLFSSNSTLLGAPARWDQRKPRRRSFSPKGPRGGGWDGHATEAAAGAAMAFCRGQV